jgi:hypothetical protein
MTPEQLAALQEAPPDTALGNIARARYVTTRHAIATWEPRPCPPDWKPTP